MLLLHFTVLIQIAYSYKFIPTNQKQNYNFATNTILHKNVAKVEEVPHHVLIVYGSYFCSGSLIRSQVVLTTASCFDRSPHRKTVVKVGADTVTGPGQVISVVEIKIHEYYKHSSDASHDVALLALKEHAEFSDKVKKIVIVDPEVALRVGTSIDVSGWGHSNLPAKYLNHLVWSEMVVISNEECRKFYNGLITDSNFCAKYQVERRLSDNGGPALFRNLLVGMLSFGGTKREEPHIAVFSNASYFHRWITLNSRRFLEKYCVDLEPDVDISLKSLNDMI
ncbi:hypothetical protein ABMA28_013734 [Loxostege sticticalis]|uniref:Peptidase S1 domain-containing protein n=1 Tax=Loxostege sticticalis TaxID=481309 RepID=A0ABD0TJD3_LOXSC